MPEGKRIDQSAWPAAGPHRELLEFLDRVHEANGTRSLAEIASLMHLSSRSRVSNLLRGINGTLPANEDQLRRLVTALGGGLDDVERANKLFRAVRAQPAVGPGEPLPVARRSKLPGPKPPSDIVLYPDVLDAVIDGLLAGQLTALVGPSGYGKTALAQQMFAEPRIVAGFGEAVYWVSIGRDLDAPELAQRLNEVTQLVCDVKPEMPDPVLAAQYLAGRIDERSCLVIFDDIWQQEWPEILRFVGSACAVLVTTRDGSLLPGGVGQHLMTGPPVELGARVLKAGAPELGDLDCARVSAVTKARPFLLDLVGSQLRQEIHAGRPPSDAVDDLLQRVSGAVDIDRLVESVLGPGEGPTAESLLAWSIERLPPRYAERLRQLALFRSDQGVPLRLLARAWDVPAHQAFAIANQFRHRSLISNLRFQQDDYIVNVHDILLDYLRASLSLEEQAALHREFVTGLIGFAVGTEEFDPVGLADAVEANEYVRENLTWHLRAYLSPSQLEQVITNPEYLAAKVVGAGVGAALADLALVAVPSDERTAKVARFVSSLRHLPGRASATASLRSFLGETRGQPRSGPRYRQIIALHEEQALRRLRGSILGCSLNANESEVLVTTSEGMVAVLDSASLRLRWTLRLPGGWTRACVFIPGGIAVGSDDGLIRLFRGSDERPTSVLAGHQGEVRSLAVSPDGNWIVSGSDDSTIRRWDLKTGLLLNTLEGHTDRVRSVAVAPDSSWIASASDDGTVRLWDLADDTAPTTLLGHTARVRGVAISPEGELIVSVSDDGTVRAWPRRGPDRHSTVLGSHGCVIRDVDFVSDGSAVLAAGAHDNLVSLWSVGQPDRRRDLVGHQSWVMCCRTSRTARWAVSGSDDGTVRRWDLDNQAELARHDGRNEWVFALSRDDRERRTYAGTTAGRIISLGLAADGQASAVEGVAGTGCRGLANGESESLIAATDGGKVLYLDTSRGLQTAQALSVSARSVRRVQYAAGPGLVVTSCHEGRIYLLREHDRRLDLVSQFSTGGGSVYEARLVPGGELVASAHESGDLCLYTVTGTLVSKLPAHRGPALSVDVTSDGRHLVSGGDDGKVRLTAIDGTALVDGGVLGRHDDWVGQVVVSPDGTRVASVSDDHTVRVNALWTEDPEVGLAFEQPLYCALWKTLSGGLVVGGAAGVYVIDGL